MSEYGDPSRPLSTDQALRGLVERAAAFGCSPCSYREGDIIMREEEDNHSLWILLTGRVQMSKKGPRGEITPLDSLGPGSLLGILSFWTGQPSFSQSVAASEAECLEIDRETFDLAVQEDSEFSRLTLQLLVANLSDRYRRMVGLNVKVEGLTRELQEERNALQEAVKDLKATRNQLVHKEKLATMGQLLAGIAHEINNPSSSLMMNVDQVERVLPEILSENAARLELFRAGQEAGFLSAGESRERMSRLVETYPGLSRPLARKLARVNEETLQSLQPALRAGHMAEVEEAVRVFDLGNSLRSIRLANERIARLVKGLKSYSRLDGEAESSCRIDTCVQDTLMVLNHRLKHFDVRVDVPDLGTIPAHAGEMNQVLTNLLANACEATPAGKAICITAGKEDGRFWLEVADEGHGLPRGLEEKIFEPNVTTKSGGGQYGLGLGLAISRDLMQQRGGSLQAANRKEGGAVFRLELPL
jgi:signal transduction histidine kinase